MLMWRAQNKPNRSQQSSRTEYRSKPTSKEHIHAISKKVASSIGALKRVRPFTSMHTAIKYIKVLSNHNLTAVVLFGMASHLS